MKKIIFVLFSITVFMFVINANAFDLGKHLVKKGLNQDEEINAELAKTNNICVYEQSTKKFTSCDLNKTLNFVTIESAKVYNKTLKATGKFPKYTLFVITKDKNAFNTVKIEMEKEIEKAKNKNIEYRKGKWPKRWKIEMSKKDAGSNDVKFKIKTK